MFDEIPDRSLQRRIEQKLEKERKRIKDEDLQKLVESVFDHKTYVRLLQHINKRHLKTVEFVISTGKEANVYYATGWDNEDFALKIFRIAATEFKKRLPYIQGDRRFRSIKRSTRGFIFEWARKEFKNLKRMHEAGVRVPQPYWIDQNLLLMQFIGKEGYPAPLLKDAELEDPNRVYLEILDSIRKMIRGAKLVHGDLSEYNIMYFEGHPVIIDVSQAVVLSHPMSREFLIRDLLNVTNFFAEFVPTVRSPRELFTELAGKPTAYEELLLKGETLS